ncbi:B3G5A glucosaminyltransferase, partial [Bucco capensis]|nr:B3G5A glucosaminyltransferase [Bucco capensis]
PPPCKSPSPFLLVLVPSAPSHFAQRQAIRQTWANPEEGAEKNWRRGLLTRTLFILGIPDGNTTSQTSLLTEAQQHQDLL